MAFPSSAIAAIQRARDVLLQPGLAVLDVETTGLGDNAEIVELAIINVHGTVLYNHLIRPAHPIPHQATAIHHIGDADVAHALPFAAHWQIVANLLAGKLVAAYNRNFEQRMLRQEAQRCGARLMPARWFCISELFADFTNSPRWRSLATACAALGVCQAPDHRALGDARAALSVLHSDRCLPC